MKAEGCVCFFLQRTPPVNVVTTRAGDLPLSRPPTDERPLQTSDKSYKPPVTDAGCVVLVSSLILFPRERKNLVAAFSTFLLVV